MQVNLLSSGAQGGKQALKQYTTPIDQGGKMLSDGISLPTS